MILAFLILFVLASVATIIRSNRKYGDLINPRRRISRRKPPKPRGPTGIPRSWGD